MKLKIGEQEFMMLLSDKDGKLTNQKKLVETINGKVNSLNQLKIFNQNYNNQNEIYLFVKVGNSI